MKSLLSVAVLALSAIMGSLAVDIPPPPLACSVVTPVKGDVWVMGKTATVTWACKSDIPLEKLTFKLLMAMELGTGTPDAFTYVDTIDNADELRRVSFPFILLTKYTPGDNYLVRIRSRNGGDPNPVTTEDDNKLQWSYSPNFKIVGPGGAANTTTGQVTTGGNSTTKNNTSSSTGGSSSGSSSSGGSSSGGSSSGSSSSGGNSTATGSSANNSTKPATGSSTNNAGIVNANLGVFLTTIVAAFVGAAFF